MGRFIVVLCTLFVAAVAVPAPSPVLRKLDEERYQYVHAGDGSAHLVDLWATADDLREAARYNPDGQNIYHLFTRQNPQVSQPLMLENNGLLGMTNYLPSRRTIVLIHGWLDNVSADFNTVLVPAFLQAEDVNVIVVDWSSGGGTINYPAAVANTLTSGVSVARFISWLNSATGASISSYHVVGFSLGAHQAGIVGRNLGGNLPYITALDPAYAGWITNDHKFRENDAQYTEVHHTNAGALGYLSNLGHCDFYPNGGIGMPGCSTLECDHSRSFHYMAESIVYSGFLGQRCLSYLTAMTGNCYLLGNLLMGGLTPKNGNTGIFYLETNASPPFSLTRA